MDPAAVLSLVLQAVGGGNVAVSFPSSGNAEKEKAERAEHLQKSDAAFKKVSSSHREWDAHRRALMVTITKSRRNPITAGSSVEASLGNLIASGGTMDAALLGYEN